jgi:hypothetical protein
MPGIYSEEDLVLLRQKMNQHFSVDEIKALCFDSGVDPEELGGRTSPKSNLVINLITYLRRRDRLESLFQVCEKARPDVSWRLPPQIHTRPNGLRIFLCHASQDKSIVRELYRKLLASGFQPWLDEEKLLAGQDWELEITRAIRESHVIIVCLSRESVSKTGFVQKEIRFALDRALEQPESAIFLIPVKLTPCEVPIRLKTFQWVNYYEENGYQNLVRALRARADKS